MALVIGVEVVDWVADRLGDRYRLGTDIGIGWEREGKLVAGVAYSGWNGVNIEAHIASEGTHWLNRQYLWTIFDYPFNQVGAGRITTCVNEGNVKSRRFTGHLGFKLEAKLAGAHPTGDLLIYRLLKTECRWIKGDSDGKKQRFRTTT